MARITSYATLATAVQDYLARDNVGVSAGNLDYLVGEVEEELNAILRVQRMLTSVTPTISSLGVVTLPADFLGWARFVARQGDTEWDLTPAAAEEQASISPLYGTPGRPRSIIQSIDGAGKIFPYTDGVYTFTALYYARIPQLTSGGSANWVITSYPSVYLYGCLAAAAGYSMDDDSAWSRKFREGIQRIQREDKMARDARKGARLKPDTPMFGSAVPYDVIADR